MAPKEVYADYLVLIDLTAAAQGGRERSADARQRVVSLKWLAAAVRDSCIGRIAHGESICLRAFPGCPAGGTKANFDGGGSRADPLPP